MTNTYAEDMIAKKLVHEIHTSTRRSFRGCRRRFKWVEEGYYPPTTVKPLEFGSAFHVAMEVMFCPTTWRFTPLVLGALAEKAFVETCEKQRQAFLIARNEYMLEDELADDYTERVELGRGMIKYFVKRQLPLLQQTYTPTHVEVSFDVPIKVHDEYVYCKCHQCRDLFARSGGGKWKGNPLVFSGRVDAVMCDSRGGYWIVDWKTAAQFRAIEEYLELDDQIAGYCYALFKAMGLNIRGFIYFEIRKDYPRPPKENASTRLGRKFSVNKQQATDYETFVETVSVEDEDAYKSGLYNDYLAYLRYEGTIFYRTTPVYKTWQQLDEIEINLTNEALDMIDPNLRVYPMPGSFHCTSCAYKGPCMSRNSQQDYMYQLNTMFIKQEPYYRRNRPSTTDKVGD